MQPGARVFVAGGSGFLGGAILGELRRRADLEIVGAADELDARERDPLDRFFAERRPDYVFVAAGASGGIHTNMARPAELMRDNLLVVANLLESARSHGVRRLMYLASSCCYPKDCPQPMRPEALLTGPLEPTSEAYALAKLAGIRMCQAYRRQYGADFVSAIPADVFGPGDEFRPEHSHVVAGLIRRFHEAKQRQDAWVDVWGTGRARRDLLYADDFAAACVLAMEKLPGEVPLNLSAGAEVSIAELAHQVRDVVGYAGELRFDAQKPEGMLRKALEAGPLRELGFRPRTPLREGLARTYDWFRMQEEEGA
jgi:GDP-L-fucose synthase